MLLKKMCAFLLFVCFFSSQVLPADIFLTEQEFSAIRTELEQMYQDTTRLKAELKTSREQSKALLQMSETLQARLELALMKLEESEALLETSQTELKTLLTELAQLRMEYGALWESWNRQKNETRKWKRIAFAGWISAGLILIGGIVWGGAK